MIKTIIYTIIAIIIITVLILGIKTQMTNAPQPKYDVLNRDKPIEIRHYPSLTIASVYQTGERKESISKGFRLLADYIFGDNTKEQKITMTAPVMQTSKNNQWEVIFIMPAKMSQKSLPKPSNQQIKLSTLPAGKMIAIRFSGKNTDENLHKNLIQLNQYIKDNNIPIEGKPIYAFYNPPWVLPLFKRNEIMYRIKEK